jgi:hypothetical protein
MTFYDLLWFFKDSTKINKKEKNKTVWKPLITGQGGKINGFKSLAFGEVVYPVLEFREEKQTFIKVKGSG